MTYIEKKFNIPTLQGISAETIAEHLKLYAGYVKHANLILDRIKTIGVAQTPEQAYELNELRRRLGFEFDGMRNHEYYFEQFEGGFIKTEGTALEHKIIEQWGSVEVWMNEFKQLASTRGVGWAWLYLDTQTNTLLHVWVNEQHDGHPTGLKPILGLDMWEHSYMLDVPPSEKKKYIENFFANINWEVVAKRYE